VTTPISGERIKELRERVSCATFTYTDDQADLLALIDDYAALKADNAYLTDKWREADMEWGKAVYQLQRAEARAAEYERKWSELVEVVATRTDQAKTMGVK
jgi:primosomal protein N''